MRFKEFKPLLEEKQKMYAVGDSHAEAIGKQPGWINLATIGRSALSPDNDAAINKVEPGSLVVLSAGANDMLSPNKQAIVNRIDSLIEKLQAKNCKVYYILFAETDNPKYAKDRNQLRQLVSSSVGSGVNVIDMGALSVKNGDGIHAPMGWYINTAKRVSSGAGTAPMPSKSLAQQVVDAGEKHEPLTQLVVPKSIRGPEVADIQKVLKVSGYREMLGNFGDEGVDGIRGKYTTRAIKKFQLDNKLKNTSGVPDEETIEKLNSIIKSTPALQKLTKSTAKDVVSGQVLAPDPDIKDFVKGDPEDMARARAVAEKYLGSKMSDSDWDMLIRATFAEASANTRERGFVAAVILNRARDEGGVYRALHKVNAFQAVTGTPKNRKGSPAYLRGPDPQSLRGILTAITKYTPEADKSLKRFTAANPAAYGPGTNIRYLYQLSAAPTAQRIGGTVFA